MRIAEILEAAGKQGAVFEAGQLSAELQQYARAAGWPENICTQLRIRQEDGEYIASFASSIADQVNDLEYGTQTTPPSPVIRTFLTTQISTHHFERGISDSLRESGVE